MQYAQITLAASLARPLTLKPLYCCRVPKASLHEFFFDDTVTTNLLLYIFSPLYLYLTPIPANNHTSFVTANAANLSILNLNE